MLTSVKIWAVAHLLVNGDLASLILFASMLAWAVLAVILINRSETRTAPKRGTAKRDIVLVFMIVFIFLLISAFHWFLGFGLFLEVLVTKFYRSLNGEDSSDFCHKLSFTLSKGYTLHGDLQYSYNSQSIKMLCA